jgi:hypothetical protein
VESLTDRAVQVGSGVGQALISSTPQRYSFGDELHIVARSPDNRLLEWWWSSGDATWRVQNDFPTPPLD